MMMNWIRELRERPEEERFAFAVMGSGAVALVLFLGWGVLFFRNSLHVGGDVQKYSIETHQQAAAAQALPFRDTFDEVVGQYQEIRTTFDGDKEARSSGSVGENVVEITVTRSGAVEVENAIVGPSRDTQN